MNNGTDNSIQQKKKKHSNSSRVGHIMKR